MPIFTEAMQAFIRTPRMKWILAHKSNIIQQKEK